MNTNNKKTIRTVLFSLLAAGVVVLCIFLTLSRDISPIESDSWAMGSALTLKIYTDNENKASALSNSVFAAVSKTDKALSATIADSDISKLNASPGTAVEISEFTSDKLSQTVTFCKTCPCNESDGSFPVDITVGKLSELWDIDSGKEKVPSDESIKTALNTMDIYSVAVNTEDNVAAISAEQRLDIGAFGKGIAADEALGALMTDTCPSIADIGGTLLLFENNPNSRNGKWNVGIRNPLTDSASSFCMTADVDTSESSSKAAFISTSGSYEKFFTENGKTYHHILSTSTGYPVETKLVSVTVISYHSGLAADGLSTACFAMGLNDNTLRLLESFSAQAIFIDQDGNYYATDGIKDSINVFDRSFTEKSYDEFSEGLL